MLTIMVLAKLTSVNQMLTVLHWHSIASMIFLLTWD
jgi:hypothetical protein